MAGKTKVPAKPKKDDRRKGLFVAVLAVAVFIWYRSGDSQKHHVKDLPAEVEQQIEVIEPNQPKQAGTVQAAVKKVAARRETAALRRQLKVESMSIRGQNPVRVPVEIKVTPQWCQIGDVDIMKASLKDQPKARILMTLEPMTRSQKFRPQVKVVSELDLEKGFSHVFQIPAKQAEGGFGFFICLDSQNQGACQMKKPYEIHDLGDAYFNTYSKIKIDRDPIFYYQLLLSDGENLDIFASNQGGGEVYQRLEQFASNHISDAGERRSTLAKTQQMHRNLSSVPAMVREKSIEITIPYMDPNCFADMKK